jgi:hypothetical protein
MTPQSQLPLVSSYAKRVSDLSIGSIYNEGKLSDAPKVSSLLAALWAENYISSLRARDEVEQLRKTSSLTEAASKAGRLRTANYLKHRLRLASAQAWSATETLLAEEVHRHGLAGDSINPWQISADSHLLFEEALQAYSEGITPRRFSIVAGRDLGLVRCKYTREDPRVIGFVSMQFHYTGQILLESVSHPERLLLEPYLKVMDDHLYMPLRSAYQAAAAYDYHSPVLEAVRSLLPISSRVAKEVYQKICQQYPDYQSHTGPLTSQRVKLSSIRDVEMFQVYLCLCVLEDDMRSVQHELFPLCVMLYPRLQVRWTLVQDLLTLLAWEMHARLPDRHVAIFLPYLKVLTEMFAVELS